jgi:hypothetical protein
MVPEVARASTARGLGRKSWLYELAAVAAAAALVIAGWASFERSNHTAANSKPVSSSAPEGVAVVPQSPTNRDDEPDDIEVSPGDIDSALVVDETPHEDPPHSPADELGEPRSPGSGYDEFYRELLERVSDSTKARPQWVDEVALGLRPVATSLGGALNTLRSTLPPSTKADADEPQAGVLEVAPTSGIS